MAIQIEFLNLVIKRSSLDRSYPGGSQAFIKEHQPFDGRVNCYDDFLVKFGAMNPQVIEDLMTELVSYGLEGCPELKQSDEWVDFCMVDELLGITGNCRWLVFEPSTREARYDET